MNAGKQNVTLRKLNTKDAIKANSDSLKALQFKQAINPLFEISSSMFKTAWKRMDICTKCMTSFN